MNELLEAGDDERDPDEVFESGETGDLSSFHESLGGQTHCSPFGNGLTGGEKSRPELLLVVGYTLHGGAVEPHETPMAEYRVEVSGLAVVIPLYSSPRGKYEPEHWKGVVIVI